jgi:hypothetical protein
LNPGEFEVMPQVIIERKQVFDWRRKEWIDEILPTLTVKRAGKYRGAGADLVVGSHFVGAGSVFLLNKLRISVGSAQSWWDLTSEGSPMIGEVQGTIDVGFLEAMGQETNLMDPNAPVVIQPGTFFVTVRNAGTATDYGCALEGLERGGGAE